jgi:tetratricopeptide (TPR) repeat protein
VGEGVTYLRQAGAKAADRSVHREAVSYFEQSLEALRRLPESRQTIEHGIDIRIAMRSSLQPLGEQAKLLERMREAEALAESLNDQGRLGQVSAYLSGYFVQAGDDALQAIETGQRALAIASAIDDFSLRIQANHFLGSAHHKLGEHDRAIDHFRRNVDSLVGDKEYERFGLVFLASIGSRYQLVQLLSDRGEFNEAAIHGREVVRIAEVIKHPFDLHTAYYAVGYLQLGKGAIDKAITMLEHSLEICRSWNFSQIPRVEAALGNAYAIAGRVSEALPVLDFAKNRVRLSFLRGQLAQGYLLIGKLEEAASLASRALDFSRRHAERGNEARALYVLGEIASCDDSLNVDRAVAHYQQAMALAEELRMRPLLAHCNVGLGKLYRRAGKRGDAKRHLADGVAMMRKMEMGLWLEKAETELKELQ